MSGSAIPPCPWSVTVPNDGQKQQPMTRYRLQHRRRHRQGIWTHSYPATRRSASRLRRSICQPTVANGVVYTPRSHKGTSLPQCKRRKVIWAATCAGRRSAPEGFVGLAGSPLIQVRLILNGSSGGMALCQTVKTLWKSGTGAGGHATPVPLRIGQKIPWRSTPREHWTIVDAADWQSLWTTERRQPIGVTPPTGGGWHEGVRHGWTRIRRRAVRSEPAPPRRCGSRRACPALAHQRAVNVFLFGPIGNNSEGAGKSPTSLRCLDWKTGEIKWTEPKLGFNGLIAVGGKLLVLTETGDLVLVQASPDGYKELGSAHVIEGRAFTAPVFASGKVYARNTKGDVVCWISAASDGGLPRDRLLV